MAGLDAASPVERVGDDLTFDPATGRMSLGVFDASVPPGSANAVVLDAYVDLVAQRRGHRLTDPVEVRADDLDVLADLLDTNAPDIDALIAQILGTPPEETAGLVDRLRSRKLALGLAAAAAGLVVLGTMGFGLGVGGNEPSPVPVTTSAAPATTSTPATTASTSTSAVVRPPITETADGVGLIDPLEQDNTGVGLAPATTDTAPG